MGALAAKLLKANPVFSPWGSDFPTPLHAVWAADPAWTNPGDGNAVSSWRNQSGGGDPAMTGGNRPTYRASTATYGNRPTVQFVAASSQALDFDIANVGTDYKLVVVGNVGTAGAGERLVGFGNGTPQGLGDTNGNQWIVNAGTSAFAGTSNTSPHVHRATVVAASASLWVDEAAIFAAVAHGGQQLTRFVIGAGITPPSTYGTFLNGHVHYAGIYAVATADAALTALCRALGAYCGITVA